MRALDTHTHGQTHKSEDEVIPRISIKLISRALCVPTKGVCVVYKADKRERREAATGGPGFPSLL